MNKTARALIVSGLVLSCSLCRRSPQAHAQDEANNAPIPFGLNNPFEHPNSDNNSEDCISSKSTLKPGNDSSGNPSYTERHIAVDALKACVPHGAGYMKNIQDIGVNVISQHFTRRYRQERPYFGLEETKHRNHEISVQLYVNGFNNYFWAAIEPQSTRCFAQDIRIEGTDRCYPNSDQGFKEWRGWLAAMFDYLDAHAATGKFLYIQLGNESDGEYANSLEEICRENNNGKTCTQKQINKTDRDPRNPEHYHWLAYAKLIEHSYAIIRERAPKAKIAVGAMGAGSVTTDGFQRPALEYLSGQQDGTRKCGGTGCFDVYDYHDFSKHEDYQERDACRPRDCINPDIKITKSPVYFRNLLNAAGFSDKGLVVQQGGTYTGQDDKIRAAGRYQTEADQAAYLMKRAVYLVSKGVEAMQFATYIEHFCYQDEGIHSWFTLMGLTYNGIPQAGVKSRCSRAPTYDLSNCDGQFPCPDPGRDVKKLSWFSQKKLIETLRGSNWGNVAPLIAPSDSHAAFTYAYKFTWNDAGKKPVYVVWWDWWKDYPRKEAEIEGCKKTHTGNHALMDECINALDKAAMSKNIPLNLDFDDGKIMVTEAVPRYATGNETAAAGYENAFRSYPQDVIGRKATITLGKSPAYISHVPDATPPDVSITEPIDGAEVEGDVAIKATVTEKP